MAEKEEEAPAKKGGWWKGIFGAVGGMLSGVVVMYLTPWVDKVVKPPAPVANFSVQYDGATAQFQNQSQPRGEGWWDFGDGSPLVPVSTDTEFLKHTYPRPGDYTVKLAIHNDPHRQPDRPRQTAGRVAGGGAGPPGRYRRGRVRAGHLLLHGHGRTRGPVRVGLRRRAAL